MKLYIYQVDTYRGMGIQDQGTHYRITDEPMGEGWKNSDRYDDDISLLCEFNAVGFDGQRFRLTDGGEWYSAVAMHGPGQYQFTVKESAVFLGISDRRVQALINPGNGKIGQLQSRKTGRDHFISADDLVSFAGKERPAHRPKLPTREE